MSLDAGSVWTVLGGRFEKGGFAEFDAANKQAVASATAAEAGISSAAQRTAKAHDELAAAAGRSARATDEVASSGKRLRETAPLAAMNAWSKSSDDAGKNMSKLGNFAAKGAAVGILALGAGLVYTAAKATTFNREMLKIETQAGGTRGEVKSLSKDILELAGTVPQGPKELAEGLYHVESAGFRGGKALDILKASAKGAALGNADLEDTSNAVVGALASQIKGIHGANDAMGQINATVGVGNMRMQDMAKSVATGVLPTFAQAGLAFIDYGAALATVTDNATPANVTATRLRMTVAQMVSPTKAAAKELASIGLSSTSLAQDLRKPNGLLLAVEDLKSHLQASGKTATEQDQILSNAFGRGKSSATIITLVGEIDRLRQKYDELGHTDGAARLAHSWAAFQKSQSAQFAELRSGAEAFAVTIGEIVVPSLAKLAHEGEHAMSGFISSGGAEKAGHALLGVFDTIGGAIGDLVHGAAPLGAVATDIFNIAHAVGILNPGSLAAMAAAFAGFKTATFLVPILKAVGGAMSEIGIAAASAPSLAAFAGDLLAMVGPAGLFVGAVTLAAGAFVAFRSGLFDSTSAAEKNAQALERDKQAVEGAQQATDKAAKAQIAAQRADLQRKEASEHLKQVEKEVADGTLKGAAAQNALLDARLRHAEAVNQSADSHKQAKMELDAEVHSIEKATDVATQRQQSIFKEIELTHKQIEAARQSHASKQELGMLEEKLARQQQDYNARGREAAQTLAELAVLEESRNRARAGLSEIENKNAVGVRDLQNALLEADAPRKIVTKYELEDQDAQAKLGTLAARLTSLGHQQVVAKVLTTAPSAGAAVLALQAVLHGVPGSKVVEILAHTSSAQEATLALKAVIAGVPVGKVVHIVTTAPSAESGVQQLAGAIAALSDKTVTVTTIMRQVNQIAGAAVKGITGHASGRRSGGHEAALVGEGRGPEYVIDGRTGSGYVVSEPSFVGLSPDDYVVPLEQRFRGRALGLFAALARDLDVPGYAKGKAKGKGPGKPHHHYTIPNAIPPLSLPLSEIEAKQQAAKDAESKTATKVKSDSSKIARLEKDLRTAQRNLQYASAKGHAKAKDHARVSELQGELQKAKQAHGKDAAQLGKDKEKVKEWNRTVREAKAFQTKINDRTLEVNNAANAMKLAASRDDFDAYEDARHTRLSALGRLKALINEARAQVKSGTEYALQLEGQVQQAEQETLGTEGEHYEPETPRDKEAEEEERSGMTASERAEEERIKKDIALAALTPDLGDDTSAAQELVGFLEHVLGEAEAEPGPRGGDEGIASIAEALKGARDNLQSLTTGTSSNENADLQAQINQKNEQLEAAKLQAQTAERALQVFGGSGDIGAGGANAAQAGAGIVVHQTNNMLHPADPSVLHAIGVAAVAGIDFQGSRRSVRVAVGP